MLLYVLEELLSPEEKYQMLLRALLDFSPTYAHLLFMCIKLCPYSTCQQDCVWLL